MKITNKQRGLAVLLEWKDAQRKRGEGITEACDFVMDVQKALDAAEFSDLERKVVEILYSGNYPEITQTQMAKDLGTYQQRISRAIYSSIEAMGVSVSKVHGDDYDYLAKLRLIFEVVAEEDAYIGIEEIKRVRCSINGFVPEDFRLLTYIHPKLARNTDLWISQRTFDGTVSIGNLAPSDDYHDGYHGLVDGTIIDLSESIVQLDYIPAVDYLVRKGDILAKVEVTA